MYKLDTFSFKNESDYNKAKYFSTRSNFLFALAVDYPNLYKIPMCYLDMAKAELKRLGWKTHRSDYSKTTGLKNSYRIFFHGPRKIGSCGTKACSTTKANATSFRIYVYTMLCN